MGTCSSTSQRQYVEISGKISSNIQNENTQYQEINSEQTTNRVSAAVPQQTQQANGDNEIFYSLPINIVQQQQQLAIQQQQMNQGEYQVINVEPNLCKEKIEELLKIADEFQLEILKNSLIKMIHRECEQFRNFLRVETEVFEDFIQMYLKQKLEYLNYNEQEIGLIQQINNQLEQIDKIRSKNKFIGERQLQLIKNKIRQEQLLNEMMNLEYSKQDEKKVRSTILKAIDQQLNQDNAENFQNLKKLLYVKQFYTCLLKGEAFTIDLENINVQAEMVNF